jgi:hypothetical protein
MNIFKVLASGKHSFHEETASIIVAWLLNPYMDHGLGYSFLSKFVQAVISCAEDENKASLEILNEQLQPHLRVSNSADEVNIWVDVEFSTEATQKAKKAFIDIVAGIETNDHKNNWIFAIENKIYSSSVTAGQLKTQYIGLKERLKKINTKYRIAAVYLTPDIHAGKTAAEVFRQLVQDQNDLKCSITWNANDVDNGPSITAILLEILHDEAVGAIDPLPYYTKQTLKALISFINNDFQGYELNTNQPRKGLNPLTQYLLNIAELKHKQDGFVGVKGGIQGLTAMQKDVIEKYKFQYTREDMSCKNNWLKIDIFNKIVDWRVLNKIDKKIPWKGKFPVKSICLIARDYDIYIGIKGGEKALSSMDADEIKNKYWQIDYKKFSPQWIPAKRFMEILEKKNLNFCR